MSEETTKSERTPVLEVVRGEVTLPFFDKEIKRGKKEGTKYPSPHVTEKNIQDVLKWIGDDNLVGIVNAFLSRKAQGWAAESLDDEEQFKKDTFVELASQLSARGETIKDLISRRDELLSDLEDIDVDDPASQPEKMIEAMKIMKEIKGINGAIKSKRRKTKEDVEAEEEDKAASENAASE